MIVLPKFAAYRDVVFKKSLTEAHRTTELSLNS